MRTLFGIILGAAITVGGAYLYDSHNALNGVPKEQALVNWDNVSQKWSVLSAEAQIQWDRLTSRAKTELDKHTG